VRVTVVGRSRRLDADLPDSIPVVELLGDVVGMLGENTNGAAVEWGLLKVGGARLDGEVSLADQGVGDGTMLFLRDVTSAPAAPAIDDFAGRVAAMVDAQKGRWSAAMVPDLIAWIAAGCFAAGGLAVLAGGDASGRATAGILGVVASGLAAFALVRVARRPAAAAAVMLGALPAWVAAGAGIAGLAGANFPTAAAAGLAGAAIGALAILAIVGGVAMAPVNAVFDATSVPAVVIGITAGFGGGLLQAAALLVVLELALLAMMPWQAARMVRAERLNEGRTVTSASRVASAAVIVAACAVLVSSPSWWARGLVIATAISVALRARHYRFTREVVPLLVAGVVSAFLLELPLAAWLAIGVRDAAGLAFLGIADAVVLAGGAVLVRRWSMPASVTRWLRPLELLAVAATVPLALGVLGLYDAVVHYARGLG
jgi:hypothetical protein